MQSAAFAKLQVLTKSACSTVTVLYTQTVPMQFLGSSTTAVGQTELRF